MAAVIYSNSKELDLEVSFYAQQEYLSVQGKRESYTKRNYAIATFEYNYFLFSTIIY